MKTTAYVTHSDCSRHDTGWEHPDHQGRLAAVARAVYRDMLTLFEPLQDLEAVPATEPDLRLAHAPEYLERVRTAVAEAERRGEVVPLEGGARVSAASWAAGTAAVGSALTAVEAVLAGEVRNAFCAVRPPGGDVGVASVERFGLFNSVAIAARHLRERCGIERVLVLEWSARGSRGTAEILAADPGVRFASVHGPREAMPPLGADLERSLASGADARAAIGAVEEILGEATGDFTPAFILVAAGFDVLDSDPIGEFAVLPSSIYELTIPIREAADRLCAGRLVSVLEGGYDARATGAAVVQHLRALAGLEPA